MSDEERREEAYEKYQFDLIGHVMGGEEGAVQFARKMEINRNREKRYGVA